MKIVYSREDYLNMVEKAKKRIMPLLLTIMIAALLAVSGIGIIGINTAVANATTVTSANDEADGMDEEIEGSANLTYASPTGKNSAGQAYWDFSYTGAVQSISGLILGNYKLEVWGAQGGNASNATYNGGYGGKGGYSVGALKITTTTTLYVIVGGQGESHGTSQWHGGAGGFGAAGSGMTPWGVSATVSGGAGGGGLSGIFKSTTYLNNEIIIAGGGGGGGGSASSSGGSHGAGTDGGWGGGTVSGASQYTLSQGVTVTHKSASSAAAAANNSTATGGGNTTVNSGVNMIGGRLFGGAASGLKSEISANTRAGNPGNPTTMAGGAAINVNASGSSAGGGGGGGGGYYGGGGSGNYGMGGSGGTSWIGGVTNYNEGSVSVTAKTIAGNTALPVTTINSTATEVGHTGNGFVRITQLNAPPVQSSIPTFTLNRTSTTSITTTNLNLSDADNNEIPIIKTANIYMSASTTGALANSLTGNNYWISYTISNANNASATTITNVKALRYWTGTKQFYVNITDYNTSTKVFPGADVWVSFYAKCEQGSLTEVNDTKSYGRVGSSTVTTPQTAENAGVIYNPLGTGKRTVWLSNPVANSAVTINASDLYTHVLGNTSASDEACVITSAITYGTNRYNKDTGAAVAIAGSPANSQQYTNVTLNGAVTGTYYNGSGTSSVTAGYSSISLTAKAGVASGPYYYVITIKVSLIDLKSNAVEYINNTSTTTLSSYDVDIVYRVDNTRPILNNPAPSVTLDPGQTIGLPLSQICTDPDNNTLTIADVIVPENEYISVDQYGNMRTRADSVALDYYNIGNIVDNTVEFTAQSDVSTGFKSYAIYKTAAAGANNSFVSSQAQGTADSAYAGYYVGSDNSTLYLVGNKASRDMYLSGRANKLGHFYILVRVTDAGNSDDEGIWFPVAITVNSAAPVAAGYPSADGNKDDVFYFTPLGIFDGSSYYGVGTYKGGEDGKTVYANAQIKNGAGTGKTPVYPFAYDPDNYVSYDTSNVRSTSYNNLTFADYTAGAEVTYPQRSMAFITPDALSVDNASLFAAYDNLNASNTNITNGFKEFYTVERVELFASSSILRGLTSSQINYLINNGFISLDNSTASNTVLVKYYGLKITLNRHTMSQYVSFYVHVTDVDGSTASIRVAVNVKNTQLTSASLRSNVQGSNMNYNTSTYSTTRNGSAFEFTLQVGDTVKITPYDLFYDPDTYRVNNGKITNIAPDDYNTYADAAGHASMLAGVNKTIAVYSSTTADGDVSTKNISLEKFSISNTAPQVYGGDNYARRTYVPESNGVAAHFEVTGLQRTPVSGYISFNYMISTTAGDSYSVEIHIIVANSLPHIRPEILLEHDNADEDLLPFRLTASTNLTYVNSSEAEKDTGDGYYQIDTNSYNIREFTLNDLFIDPDGDSISFYNVAAGIKVGTHDVYGNFIAFDSESTGSVPNVYLNAYISNGTNIRLGKSNCLILQGLSSTQGLPGGLWIMFDIIDNAVGSTTPVTMEFQVEVYNSTPTYADLSSGTNVLTNTAKKQDGIEVDTENPKWLWEEESASTSTIVAKVLNAVNPGEVEVVVAGTSTQENPTKATIVNKPMYIASSKSAMDAYKASVNSALTRLSLGANYSYADSQVRYIATDPDIGQGLSLWGAAYYGTSAVTKLPGFGVVPASTDIDLASFGYENNEAVLVTPIYSTESSYSYYAENCVVQIVTFENIDGNLNLIDPLHLDYTYYNGTMSSYEAANTATDWVIAFNFTSLPDTFDVRIRLRDSNNNVVIPTFASADDIPVGDASEKEEIFKNQIGTGTQGGFTYFRNTASTAVYAPNAYAGKRTVADGQFVPNAVVSNLYNNTGVFGLTISKRPQGLFNNFTKWSNSVVINDVEYTNVWALDASGYKSDTDFFTYANINSEFANTNGVFQYTGIDVPIGANGVSVPISYFAWPAEITSSSERGSGQKVFAWYDIPNFPKAGKTTMAAVQNSEFSAISLSDGYTTWSGENLNKNPYVTFTSIYDNPTSVQSNGNAFNAFYNNADVTSGNYLYAQQRFAVTESATAGEAAFSSLPVLETGTNTSCFFEDTYGLTIKKNAMRSVGQLTLSIRFATWQLLNGDYEKSTDEKGVTDVITVTVPLTVANTELTISQSSLVTDITTNTSESGKNVALTTNYAKDSATLTGVTFIQSQATDDQWVASSGLYNPNGYTYRENTYFLSSSLVGSLSIAEPNLDQKDDYSPSLSTFRMSEAELNTIKAYAKKINADYEIVKRLAEYFGLGDTNSLVKSGIVADAAAATTFLQNYDVYQRIANLEYVNGEVKYSGMKASDHLYINPYYNNYFTISPTATDSTQIAIIPSKITTFNYAQYESRAEIEAAAAERNLKVAFTSDTSKVVSKIYYPLKAIVYDRLSVGYAGNTTTFEESSFDVVTINICVENSTPSLTSMFTSTIRPTQSATSLYGRTVSLAKDTSVYYSFTDLINDGNMIVEEYSYLTKEQVEKKGGITKDTGDYLKQITDSNGKLLDVNGKADGEDGYSSSNPLLVQVEFMSLVNSAGASIGTNQYTAANTRGAVQVVPSTTGIRIWVRNRAQNVNASDGAAAYIKLTFTDRFDKSVSCYIAVRITNAAPELTPNAIAVREITMKTGQYFTLYVTEFSDLIEGESVSTTVGTGTASVSGTQYNGTYFSMVASGDDSNSKNLSSTGNHERASWTLQDGVTGNNNYNGMPNIPIGQESYNYSGTATGDNANNLGYMAIATDDAAWTLRIPRATGYTSSVSSSIIGITELNLVSYEGSSLLGCTALMFEARGATTGANISITVFDGVNDGLSSDVQSVTYTFKIIVESTPPIGIDINNQTDYVFASNVVAQNPQHPEMANRISINTASVNGHYEYDLKMYAGESIKLLTSDFAYDIDSGDTSIMYLLPRSGDNPFVVNDMSTGFVDMNTFNTTYVQLTQSSNNSTLTTKNIAFTVTALNFHNGSADDKLYSQISFYICDPHSSSIEDSIEIILNVYIYPSEVDANSISSVRTIEINGVTSEDAIKTVSLVTATEDEGGLFVDNDAQFDNTRYSVQIYSLAHYKAEGNNFVTDDDGNFIVESYTENEFNNLADKNGLLIADFTITSSDSNGISVFSGSGYSFDKDKLKDVSTLAVTNCDIVNTYISDISFSADGTEMYITPAKATSAAHLIAGANNTTTGFQLGVKIKKFVERKITEGIGYYPDKASGDTPPTYGAEVITKVSVSNSAPEAVGEKDENMGQHINVPASNADANRSYLSMAGTRGDYWLYYLYNFTNPDVALFTDPDGDTIDYADSELVGLYTYEIDENGRATRKDHFSDEDAVASAKTAYTLAKETQSVVYPYGSNVSVDSYPAIKVAIQHKVVIPGITGRTVYLEIRVRGKDPYSSKLAETILTLAIDNSAPMFKADSEDNVLGTEGIIADKYNSDSRNTSYEHVLGSADASLTLTLNKDDADNVLSSGGELRVPLMDLIGDIDYDTSASNTEQFSFVSTGMNNVADLANISGDSSLVMWISEGAYGVVSNYTDVSDKRFTVQVERDNNLTLVIKINSYDRGERESFVLKVRDRDGAETGILTVTLVIGNSTPIDKTRLPDGDPDKANPNIVLAGGKTGTNANGTFDAQTYSILSYVTDNNPDDKKAYASEPVEPANYLRIVSITPGPVYLDDGTLYVPEEEEEEGSGSGSGSGSGGGVEANLVQISTDNTQKFTITPIAGMYGTQTLTFRISDGGNMYSDDTEYISIDITVQITKNPDDMDTYDFHVYWRRTKEFTAKELFDNPETVTVDESSGLLIKKVELVSNSPYVSLISDTANYKFSVEALTKNNGVAIAARVTVVVGTEITEGATEYVEEFNIFIDDNLKPYFRTDPNSGVTYDNQTTLFYKGDIDDDGICQIPVTFFFDDAEDGDEIRLVTASSIKSTIISVSADTSSNMFVFQFKSSGDTTIKCQVSDAVATYDYQFKVGNADLPEPNFFIGIISRIQENPLIFIIIGAGIFLFLLILILIIAAVRKKKKMRAEIEALLVSEMELEEQMLKLAAGSTPYMNNAFGYLPPTPGAGVQPGLMLGSGTGGPAVGTGAIGLNPGGQQNAAPQNNNAQLPPPDAGFNDDDL